MRRNFSPSSVGKRLRSPLQATAGIVTVFLLFSAATASAQTPTNECGAPPADGGRVVCDATTYPLPNNATHRGNISYYFEDDVATPKDDNDDYTVFIDGSGLGELRYLTGDTSIEGTSNSKFGVIDIHGGTTIPVISEDDSLNDVDLTVVLKDVTVDTTDATVNNVRGLFSVLSASSGDLRIEVDGGSYTTGNASTVNGRAISAVHDGSGGLYMTVTGATIDTTGINGLGLDAWHDEFGHVEMTVTDTRITTNGDYAHAVRAYQRYNDPGDTPAANNPGHVVVRLENTHISTRGLQAFGLYANHNNNKGTVSGNPSYGDIRIAVKGGSIETEHALAAGIYALHRGVGNIVIDLENAAITTKGAAADFDGQTYTGANAILAVHENDGAIDIAVRGGSIRTLAESAYGIVASSRSKDSEGYVRQTVRVNGSVSGGAGGIDLDGGGRVFVGPRGFVGAGSDEGVAIHSAGDGAKLLVSLELDGRPPSEALLGRIVNDKGTEQDATRGPTVLIVNGTVLYDENGRTNATAPNGIYDILGVGVDTATADRLELSFAETKSKVAPRASIYEALPGFLLRLDGDGALARRGPDSRISVGDTPLWMQLSGGQGSFEASSGSTVGADYDLNRWESAFGADIPLGGGLTGTVGLRLVSGSADVSALTGGGEIDAEGHGVVGALTWRGAGGYYAAGRASAMGYDLDLASSARGALAEGVDATVRSWGAEAGRRAALAANATVTVRGWLDRSEADMDGVTDAAGSRLSLADSARTNAGMGFGVETVRALEGGAGELALSGFAGLEFALDDETAVTVSGAELRSRAPGARVQLGLGADLRIDEGMTLAADLSADGIDSSDRILSASLALRIAF